MGIHMNENLQMSMQEYLRYPALSSSALAHSDESMAKYRAYMDGKIRYESKALDLGSAVHLMIENPSIFEYTYAIKPNGIDYRTKEGKAWKAENSDRILLDSEQMETVLGCYEAWRTADDPLIRIARESVGEAEISRFWREGNILCKARADRLVTVSGSDNEYLAEHWPSLFNPISNTLVVDFKTTSRNSDPRSWYYTSKMFKYPLKSCHYLEGFNADAFLWVVLETSPPYQVSRYLLGTNLRDSCVERRNFLLHKIEECESSGIWPGLSINDQDTLIDRE